MGANQFLFNFFSHSIPNKDVCESIVSRFKLKELKKGDYLLKEGQISNEYILLENGFIRSFSINLSGDEISTGFYSSQSPVFEPASFFLRQPSKEYFQALTDSLCWFISFEELNKLFHDIPQFREFGRQILVKTLAQSKMKYLASITEPAEKRYLDLLENNSEIFQFATLKQVATYLGITDTSLSRIRRKLNK